MTHISYTLAKELIHNKTKIPIKDIGRVFDTLSDIIYSDLQEIGDSLVLKNLVSFKVSSVSRDYEANLKQHSSTTRNNKTIKVTKSRNLKKGLR